MAPSTWESTETNGSMPGGADHTAAWRFLLLCALGGLVVYALGLRRMNTPEAYVATAKVYQEAASPAKPAQMDPSAIDREILSDKSLGQAIRQLDLGQETPEQVRERLSVSFQAEPKRGCLKIAITCREQSRAEQAVGLVNKLAESYAHECRNRALTAARDAHAKVRETADRANEAAVKARQRLDAFLEAYFAERDDAVEEAGAPGTEAAEAGAAGTDSQKARETVNPQWLDLSRQLGQLEWRRSELLGLRRPEHPEVREVDAAIDQIRGQLATTPRQVTSEGSAASGGGSSSVESDRRSSMPRAAQARSKAAETFRSYRDALRRADADCERAGLEEREAWRRQLSDAGVAVDLAWGYTEVNRSVDVRRLMMFALGTGLSFAVGNVLVSRGCSARATFFSAQQVRTVLGIPVVGSLPTTEPSSKLGRRLGPASVVLIVCGLLLVAAGAGLLLAVSRGMFLG